MKTLVESLITDHFFTQINVKTILTNTDMSPGIHLYGIRRNTIVRKTIVHL